MSKKDKRDIALSVIAVLGIIAIVAAICVYAKSLPKDNIEATTIEAEAVVPSNFEIIIPAERNGDMSETGSYSLWTAVIADKNTSLCFMISRCDGDIEVTPIMIDGSQVTKSEYLTLKDKNNTP